MQSRRVVAGLIAIFALVAFATGARAGTKCSLACERMNTDCRRSAQVNWVTCTQDCHQEVQPLGEQLKKGACKRACADAHRADEETCKANQTNCLASCLRSGQP
jgi:hypothetical protein